MNFPELERAIDVIQKLRDPNDGCPWDLKQTHSSLLKYLIEESYEYIEAVENHNLPQMKDELGDILLQVLLHAQIADDNKNFSIEGVAKNLADKMIRRHPHVFTNKYENISESQIVSNWEKIKKEEKSDSDEYFFTSKDLNLPALSSSHKIGKKSQKVKFDWNNYHQVLKKVKEELAEVEEELKEDINKKKLKEELGDLLFSVAQLSRHLGIDPESALREGNKKFINRFNSIEKIAKDQGKEISSYTKDELENLWIKVKKNGL